MILKDKKIRSEYVDLLTPLVVEQVFIFLIGFFNTFLFSRISDEFVSVSRIGDQLLAIGTMAMGIVSLGSTVLFLQNADEENVGYVRKVARQTVYLNLLLAIILFSVVSLFGHQIVNFMNAGDSIHDMTVLYLRIVSTSLVFQGVSTTISALLRAYGRVKQAMVLSIIGTVLNIVGNLIVVTSPLNTSELVVPAVSVATVLSRLIACLLSMYVARRELPEVTKGILKIEEGDFNVAKNILKLGIPSGMESVFYNISQTIMTSVIAGMGTTMPTVQSYTMQLTGIVFAMSMASGQAVQIMLGRYIRKSDHDSAQKFALENLFISMGIGFVITFVIALFGKHLVLIFTDDPVLTGIITKLLWLNCLYEPLRVANEVIIACLNVTGDVKYPVYVGVIVTYLFTIPASYFIASRYGIYAMWIIFILDEGIRFLILLVRWNKGVWKDYDLQYSKESENN